MLNLKNKMNHEYNNNKRKRLPEIENKLVFISGEGKDKGRRLRGTNYYI